MAELQFILDPEICWLRSVWEQLLNGPCDFSLLLFSRSKINFEAQFWETTTFSYNLNCDCFQSQSFFFEEHCTSIYFILLNVFLAETSFRISETWLNITKPYFSFFWQTKCCFFLLGFKYKLIWLHWHYNWQQQQHRQEVENTFWPTLSTTFTQLTFYKNVSTKTRNSQLRCFSEMIMKI